MNGYLKFEDALKWLHLVFDPRQELNTYEQTKRWARALPVGAKYWTFLPFFANQDVQQSLSETLGLSTKTLDEDDAEELEALINEWRIHPFNPHLVARHRITAYQKYVVMVYLDALLQWGDHLFRQDTIESINRATQLYVLADELLGDRPEQAESLNVEPRYTYRDLATRGIDAFANAAVDLEYMLATSRKKKKKKNVKGNNQPLKVAVRSFYFKMPRNERLDSYWDTVQDRLFKIRNSMNIDGVKRQLRLFEPPIDPALLVRAYAAGLDLSSILAQLNAPLPHYRFSVWMQKASELCGELRGFGGAILSALEKQDAEALQRLRQGHEIRMLELMTGVREQQIKEAEENITALQLSRATVQARHDYYKDLERVSGAEQDQINQTRTAGNLEIAAGIAQTLGGLLLSVPDAKVGMVGPFPLAGAEIPIGTALSHGFGFAAAALGTGASAARAQASILGITSGHARRTQEWSHQEAQALLEIGQIDQQIVAAEVRLAIAKKELENHQQQIEHAVEVRDFLEEKFTNTELYRWMVSQLSRTFQSVYKLTYDVAKTAERTFQFELGTEETFLKFDYEASLRHGLLAGERLYLDLKRMDVAYLEKNRREHEVTKPISLAMLNGQALQKLRETGECTFEVPEVLFDLDFPGHYFRRIRGVRVTIPCVTGPYTSVSAKLTLTGSAMRKKSTANPTDYAYKGIDDPNFVHDLVGIQSIATSTAQQDPGLFEFNFRDERYLPFEGAGAISKWRLELPTALRQFDYGTISDVVLHMSYTARDAGGTLAAGAKDSIKDRLNHLLDELSEQPTGLVRAFSLAREFPDALHALLTQPGPVDVVITPEHFPHFITSSGRLLESIPASSGGPDLGVHVIAKPGVTSANGTLALANGAPGSQTITNPTFDANRVAVGAFTREDEELLAGGLPEIWSLSASGLTPEQIEDIVLVINYTIDAANP